MKLEPIENFKGFVKTRPPLVVFMICLGLFGFVLVTLAFFIKTHKTKNPDVSQDWNVFLDNFAELELCITGNNTDMTQSNAAVSSINHTHTANMMQQTTLLPDVIKQGPGNNLKNHSVQMLLTIQPTKEFLTIQHNITHITGTITGEQLGLTGDRAENVISIGADLPYEWNSTLCNKAATCNPVKIVTCVHFVASADMFPNSRGPNICENLNETGLGYHARVIAHKTKPAIQTYAYCRSRPVIHCKHTYDPSLAVWLSAHDQSVINLHLMHTSYFLFVMVVMLFCYAIIRGKPISNKVTQTEKLISAPI